MIFFLKGLVLYAQVNEILLDPKSILSRRPVCFFERFPRGKYQRMLLLLFSKYLATNKEKRGNEFIG